MQSLNKTHYAALRESVTATDAPVQELLLGLRHTMTNALVAEPTMAALKQLNTLAWREAEVMTFNNLFQTISGIFLAALCVAPFLKKVNAKKAAELPME
jgi:DHA2 family multidrug resistance protein